MCRVQARSAAGAVCESALNRQLSNVKAGRSATCTSCATARTRPDPELLMGCFATTHGALFGRLGWPRPCRPSHDSSGLEPCKACPWGRRASHKCHAPHCVGDCMWSCSGCMVPSTSGMVAACSTALSSRALHARYTLATRPLHTRYMYGLLNTRYMCMHM